MNFGHPLRARFACTRPLRVLCTTTVIPAKAGIQRGRATASKAKRQAQTPSFPLEHQGEGLCTAPLSGAKGREMVWFVLLWVHAFAGMTCGLIC